MKITNTNPVLKSVGTVVEDDTIKLDCRLKNTAKLPKGKTNNRFRFTTGIKATPSNLKAIEKNKFDIAQEHYESLFLSLENKEIVVFEDIAHIALKEAEADRKKEDATKDYQNILKNFVLPTFAKMPLKEIKVKDIKAWMLEMAETKLSQSRFNKRYYVVKRVLDYAVENEYIDSNPVNHVKKSSKLFIKPKDKSSDYFSKEEMQKILNDTCENGTIADKKNHPFIRAFMYVALYTGARTGEIMALRVDKIDFENNTIIYDSSIRRGIISTTKTGKSRTVPMIKALSEVLKEWIGDKNNVYVFPKPNTDIPFSNSSSIVNAYYKPMLKRLNIPFKILYNSRHTFASISIENKIPVSLISRCLGHSTISTTERFYIKHSNANQDDIRFQLESLTA